MVSSRRLLWAAPLLFAWLGPPSATAGPADRPALRFEGGTGPEVPLAPDQYRPRFDPGGQAWESWEYAFRFPNGYTLLAQFQISNLGLGSHRGLVVGIILGPDGRSTLIKNGRARDSWTYEAPGQGCTLKIAKHVLSLEPPRHRLHVQNSQGEFTVEAESLTPSLRAGRIRLDASRFYDLTVLAPRLKARGSARFPGGPLLDLGEGVGVALRSYSNLADYQQAASVFRFHSFDPGVQLSLAEITTTAKHGSERLGFLWMVRGSRVVFRSYDVDRRFTLTRRDAAGPGYPVPQALTLGAGRPDPAVSGQAKLELRRRDDLLGWLDSALVRFVVRQFSHPVQYVFDAEYAFDVETGGVREKLTGRALALCSILNHPRKDRPW
ncbi:MAG TPA: hypothetical protein VJU18_04820 [Vicinamibacteria bacterium]|nr:hypothetical protein [Vicinamibacteria bacterium]